MVGAQRGEKNLNGYSAKRLKREELSMPTPKVFSNNAITSLNAAISAVDTAAVAVAGGGALFTAPTAPEILKLTFFDENDNIEIVHCTLLSGDTFTIVRDQEGTTSPVGGWPSGTLFSNQVTKNSLDDFIQKAKAGDQGRNSNFIISGRMFN